jgi:hypothetical protein
VTQNDVVAKLGSTKVEMAMPKAQLFCRKRFTAIARHRDHGRFGRTDQTKRSPTDFDVATCQLGVAHLGRPGDDVTGDEHDTLGAEAPRQVEHLGRGVVRIERDLDDPRAIAEVDEYETAEITAAMHPPSEPHARSYAVEPKRPAQRVAERGLERQSRTRSDGHRVTPGSIVPRANRPHLLRGPRLEGAMEVSAGRCERGLQR